MAINLLILYLPVCNFEFGWTSSPVDLFELGIMTRNCKRRLKQARRLSLSLKIQCGETWQQGHRPSLCTMGVSRL